MTAGTKALDVAHKVIVTGLIGAATFGLYDVLRGFNVMYHRNVIRNQEWAAKEAKRLEAAKPT
jgi:hypothetical protein